MGKTETFRKYLASMGIDAGNIAIFTPPKEFATEYHHADGTPRTDAEIWSIMTRAHPPPRSRTVEVSQ